MNIFPALRYRDAPAAIDWLERTLGFERLSVHANKDGSIAHAELKFGTGVVGLNSAHQIPGNPWSDVRQGIYVYLPDVDAHHDRARAAGAEIITPLKDTDYGSREYAVRDPEGHLWGFGTYTMSSPGGEPNFFVGVCYRDLRAAVGWLTKALGFRSTLEVPGPDGALAHAEMRLGEGTIFVEEPPRDTAKWGDNNQALYVYEPDPDRLFARASAAGAAIVQPIETTSYGARGFYVRDPEDFLWGFSTYRTSSPGAAAAGHP